MVWKLLIICGVFGIIEAGVKIEISRVKDPPKSVTNTSYIDSNKSGLVEMETTEGTTLPTTTAYTTTLPLESHIIRLINMTTNSTTIIAETTTMLPLNVTGTMKAQANITNTSTSFTYNITLVPVIELNPYLAEFTRRQMRRRLIPDDYYCPCDLKVNFKFHVFLGTYFVLFFQMEIFFTGQFL